MIRFEKHFILALIVGVLVFSICTVPSYGLMFANDTEGAYDKKDKKDQATSSDEVPQGLAEGSSLTMGEKIVNGASHFLGSYSDLLLFLNEVELSGVRAVDYQKLGTFLDNAIQKMESARGIYVSLICEAEQTPYNEEIIRKLLEFDYRQFKRDYRLNPVVFNDVSYFLGTGNVRGGYYWILYRMDVLLYKLYLLKDSVNYNVLPEIGLMWDVNREYSNLLFFGQYMAMVFNRILGRF